MLESKQVYFKDFKHVELRSFCPLPFRGRCLGLKAWKIKVCNGDTVSVQMF